MKGDSVGGSVGHDDSLVVSGGGSTAVAVDELFVDAARLGATAAVLDDWMERARVVRLGLDLLDLDEATVVRGATAPAWCVGVAAARLEQASADAGRMRSSLVESAERYGVTERFVDGLWQLAAFIGAPWLGLHAPVLVMGGLLAASGHWAGSAAWRALGWGPTPLESWARDHRALLSDPAFVRLVRAAADHADEALATAARLPVPSGFGVAIGAPESASMLLAGAGLLGTAGSRVLVDGPVRVTRVDSSDAPAGGGLARGGLPPGHPAAASALRPDVVAPPSGVGDLADRVPSGGDGEPQIRIERYGTAADPRWIVYVGGTVELGLAAGGQSSDMTSNVHGVADDAGLDALRFTGADSGAGERAVRAAMREAGVRPGDPLLAVGHSGGGIIAAKVAADPELGAVGAVSLGGPVASAPTRDGVPLLSIEHEEDLVPAIGGAGHPSPERLTVSRSVLEPGREYEAVLPAHELGRYRQTAALVDASEEERLAAFRALVEEVAGGGAGLRSDWLAEREVSPATDGR